MTVSGDSGVLPSQTYLHPVGPLSLRLIFLRNVTTTAASSLAGTCLSETTDYKGAWTQSLLRALGATYLRNALAKTAARFARGLIIDPRNLTISLSLLSAVQSRRVPVLTLTNVNNVCDTLIHASAYTDWQQTVTPPIQALPSFQLAKR